MQIQVSEASNVWGEKNGLYSSTLCVKHICVSKVLKLYSCLGKFRCYHRWFGICVALARGLLPMSQCVEQFGDHKWDEGKRGFCTEWNQNEGCCPLQGGMMTLRSPCRRQTQSLKSHWIRSRRGIVLQLWLSVTKLYVSNSNRLSYCAFDSANILNCEIFNHVKLSGCNTGIHMVFRKCWVTKSFFFFFKYLVFGVVVLFFFISVFSCLHLFLLFSPALRR